MSLLQRAVEPRDWARGPGERAGDAARVRRLRVSVLRARVSRARTAASAACGDRIRFVFRHFPLSQMHPHAALAAEAAEAAGAQGKFWEMHDTLFTHQDALGRRRCWRTRGRLRLDVAALHARAGRASLPAQGAARLHGRACAAASTERRRCSSTARAGTAHTRPRRCCAGCAVTPSMIVEPMTGLPWGGDA